MVILWRLIYKDAVKIGAAIMDKHLKLIEEARMELDK